MRVVTGDTATVSHPSVEFVKVVGADSQSHVPLGKWVAPSDWIPNCIMAVVPAETFPGMLMTLTLLLLGMVKRMPSWLVPLVMASVPGPM